VVSDRAGLISEWPMSAAEHIQQCTELGRELASTHYRSRRSSPPLAEGDYLILSDVRRLIQRHAPEFHGDVFDYGCGGAPYSEFFAGCRAYVKADVTPGEHVERLLRPDGLTGESDASYDWVFSTQVLEHVPAPRAYLIECLRILRPGGVLLLTTHGFYPEHGCPHDFHRWTLDGLRREVSDAGFEILSEGRLTAGVRAAVQLGHHCVWNLRPPQQHRVWGGVLGAVRKVYGWLAVPVLNWLADRFPEQSIANTCPGSLYVGIYIKARKRSPLPSPSSTT
jgi:hypothetical protein